MIDTLKIRLNDYELKNSHNFHLQPSILDSNNEIVSGFYLSKIDNNEIHGMKMYYNDPFFNCTIMNDYSNRNNMTIQFSLPRFYSQSNNLVSLDLNQTKESLQNLDKRLNEVGVKTNIFNSTIIRLDSFKNIITDNSFDSYKDIFKKMKLSRKETKDYGSTLLYKNKSSQICVYDKIKEMKDKKVHDNVDYSIPDNVIRFEKRILKKRGILSELKFDETKILTSKDGFLQVMDNYYNNMKNSLFKLDSINDFSYYSKDEIKNELMFYKSKSPIKYLDYFIRYNGFKLLDKSLNYDTLFEIIRELEFDNDKFRNKKSVLKKILYNFELDREMMKRNEQNKLSSNELYKELKTKMFKKVS